ncbi:MAG: hypothetical protein PHE15_00240 [Dehalococcoidales bacterium]|nr:hypothetical protein [Dehalococcoidales bacterium]
MISNSSVLAEKICKALNIPFSAIRRVHIEADYDSVAILEIEKIITVDEGEAIVKVLEEYELRPIEKSLEVEEAKPEDGYKTYKIKEKI